MNNSDYPQETTDLVPTAPKKIGRPKGSKDSYKRPPRSDRSWTGNAEQTPAVTSHYIHHIRSITNLPPITVSDITQVENRINEYLDICENDGLKPSVMGLCNALNIDKRTLYRWANGEARPGTHQEVIVRYYRMLEEFWELQMQEGKINPVSGIFLGKNHFGYADKQEVVLTPHNPLGEVTDQKELEERYLESIVIDSEDIQSTDNG